MLRQYKFDGAYIPASYILNFGIWMDQHTNQKTYLYLYFPMFFKFISEALLPYIC